MGEYFKPWRRKFGVVTLLMACVFAAVWISSLRSDYGVSAISRGEENREGFGAIDGQFVWLKVGPADRNGHWFPEVPSEFPSISRMKDGWAFGPGGITNPNILWICQSGRFGVGILRSKGYDCEWQLRFIMAPWWSVTLPITLISAWLLLSQPRKSTSKKIDEPSPTEVA